MVVVLMLILLGATRTGPRWAEARLRAEVTAIGDGMIEEVAIEPTPRGRVG